MAPKYFQEKDGKLIFEINPETDFKVVVFGSARIQPGDKTYEQVYNIGRAVGLMGADIVTGGGPGLMEAANAGHMDGKQHAIELDENGAHSIGVGIKLPFEESLNDHLDLKAEYDHFSDRLDMFMALSNIVVVAPGGIGTLLELAYTWQLVQVGHICKTPIVLIGDMWKKLIEWVKEEMMTEGLISEDDLDFIHVVKNEHEAIALVKEAKDIFHASGDQRCLNWDMYEKAVMRNTGGVN